LRRARTRRHLTRIDHLGVGFVVDHKGGAPISSVALHILAHSSLVSVAVRRRSGVDAGVERDHALGDLGAAHLQV